ncbi:MraY family glycosyltransferase [Rubellicoccus peritrichatus]|uniref:MraY family glycosyltransferase n=1 Tax=Rubellicoccus peritrichatus TaxID=3080537 RepID=A0AAQ3QWW7_9BACT|nr:MraY family glycosyltransferase [Puniceicoccus sp. CR14]WOO42347.1 MraY family glycosyltransferase [Puniceicoccus sp. CR14]
MDSNITVLAISMGALLCAMLVSLVAIIEAKKHATKLGLVDEPDHRKVHISPIPRVGGIGIITGFFAGILFLQIVNDVFPMSHSILNLPDRFLLTGAIVIAVTGLVDDFRGISFRQKLVVQCLVSVYIILAGYRLNLDFGIYPGYAKALSVPITFMWIIGVTNAVNLIDGLDGLAGGIFLISLLVISICSVIAGIAVPIVLIFCMVGAVLGFLFLNWHPAKTFMGDSGSLFLGYIIACYSLQTTIEPQGFFVFLVPVLAVGLPVLDTLLSMIRRLLRGRPMFYPDKDHIHHRIQRVFNYSQRQTVYSLYAINALLGCFAIALMLAGTIQGLFITLAASLFVILLLYRLRYISIEKLKHYIHRRRKPKRVYAAPMITFGK